MVCFGFFCGAQLERGGVAAGAPGVSVLVCSGFISVPKAEASSVIATKKRAAILGTTIAVEVWKGAARAGRIMHAMAVRGSRESSQRDFDCTIFRCVHGYTY